MTNALNVPVGELALLTERAAGAEFALRHRDHLRFNHTAGKWMVYDQGRWRRSDSGQVERLAKELADAYFNAANSHALQNTTDWAQKLFKFAARLASSSGQRALLASAQSELSVSETASSFDSAGNVFNLLNGTIELSTRYQEGSTGYLFRAHDPADLLTKSAAVEHDPAATCPRFDGFLAETFRGDGELTAYVQRLLGSCMAAGNPEHVFPVCWGQGGNGKSTLFSVVLRIFGDYGQALAGDALLKKRAGSASNDIAELDGARLAVASELADTGIDLQLVKRLTGGDRVRARLLYENNEEFTPDCTIISYTNDKPKLRADDEGIWRRVHLVPFTNVVTEATRQIDLGDILWSERSGILNWLLKGYASWLRVGLNPPAVVEAATDELRRSLDLVERFVEECCDVDASSSTPAQPLQDAFKRWCEENAETRLSATQFKQRMEQLGHPRPRSRGGYRYSGIALREVAEDDLPDDLPEAA